MSDPSIVHVVDDDDDLRLALDSLFRSVGFKTRLYPSVLDFLNAGRLGGPGCLVLDVRMPGVSGLEFQAQLNEMKVSLPVILMTGHGDIPMTVQAMKAGAVDFLTKPFRDQDMLDAVAQAIDQDLARRAIAVSQQVIQARFDTLTPRERQVMALVIAGRMNKQIAGDLNISDVTVKIHRGVVMRKMQVRSLADLVRAGETLFPSSIPASSHAHARIAERY